MGSHFGLCPACPPRGPSARGMFVLACFSPTCRILTAAQIARQIDLAPAMVESVGIKLVALGCLTLDQSGAYLLAGASPNLGIKR